MTLEATASAPVVLAAMPPALLAPDHPDALTHGTGRMLVAALADARGHTLALAEALAAGLTPAMEVRYLPELNPPLWLLAELAWREDGWIARNPLRRQGAASAEGFARGPAAWPQWDRSFGPKLSHADRWHQPVPSLRDTLALLHASRQRSLALLRGTPNDDTALHVFRDALWREDALREILLGIAQTLGFVPGPLAAAPLPCPASLGDMAVPAGTHPLAAPDRGYRPGTSQPAHTAELRAFSIDRAPVNWQRFLPFIESGGYEEMRWWTPEGWAWRKRHSLGRPRHLGRSEAGHWQLAQFGQWVPLDPSWPALHLSRHEALAWCRWAGRRLPSETEWEAATRHAARHGEAFAWGQALEWTASTFAPGQSCVRGASHLGSPRLATPWARWPLADERNDAFVGFRSAAQRPEGEAGHEHDDAALNAVAQPEENMALSPVRKRSRKKLPAAVAQPIEPEPAD